MSLWLAPDWLGASMSPARRGPAGVRAGDLPGVVRADLRGVLAGFSRLISFGSEAQLATKLRQAGLYPGLTAQDRVREYRVRSFLFSAGLTVLGGLFGLALRGVAAMLLFGASGLVIGVLFSRSRVDGAVSRRRDRIRSELYTVNQLIAMRTRVGGGVVDALRHTVDRAHGVFVDELAEVLRLHERGLPIGVALHRAAQLTPEPEAARTYERARHRPGARLRSRRRVAGIEQGPPPGEA